MMGCMMPLHFDEDKVLTRGVFGLVASQPAKLYFERCNYRLYDQQSSNLLGATTISDDILYT